MTRRSAVLPLVAALLLGGALAACSDDDDPVASTTTRPEVTTTAATGGSGDAPTPLLDAPTGTLTDHECWGPLDEVDPQVTVTCHVLTVPADWAAPDGDDTVELPITRLHHASVAADVEPMVVLHGGPGGSVPDTIAASASGGELVKGRDVIFYDQRGSGHAVPSLNCPEKEQAVMDALATTDSVEDELARNVEATQACRDRLVGEGIDLNDYNTHASVNDLDALRDALDLDTWNVQGGSYGSRLGLAYARQHPDRIRALVLDSVYPPQVGSKDRARDLPVNALARLVDECTGDDACAAAYPDLGATIEAAAADLDEDPAPVTIALDVAGTKEERTYHIVGSDFRTGMFAALYDNSIIPLIPSVIGGLAESDRSILPTFLETASPRLTGLSEGAYLSIDCADGGRLLDGATAEDIVGDGDFLLYALILAQTFCTQWDVTPLPESFNEPAVPDVPTIVFAGTLDPVTPYTDSQEQAEAMPDARFVLAPRGGHGDTGFDDCTREAHLAFLADPTSDLPPCVAEIQPPPFSISG